MPSTGLPSGSNHLNAHPYAIGAGIKLGILDSGDVGISPDQYLGDRLIDQVNFQGKTPSQSPDPVVDPQNDHETLVAHIAAGDNPTYMGVAPQALVFDAGMREYDPLRAATSWLYVTHDVKLFNLSSGFGINQNGNTARALYLDWFQHTNDALLFKSAGNSGDLITDPGGFFNGITVGNFDDSNQKRHSSSAYQIDESEIRVKPDILAPGTSITDGINYSGNPITGTSFAAPHVTGTAALVQQYGRDQLGAQPDHLATKAVILNSARKRVIVDPRDSVSMSLDRTPHLSHDREYLNLLGSVPTFAAPDTMSVSLSWTPTSWSIEEGVFATDKPLDDEQGVGFLDAARAVTQVAGGLQTSGTVPGIGWSRGSLAVDAPSADQYALDQAFQAGSFITATLVWDRIVTEADGDGIVEDDDTYAFSELANLDLQILDSANNVIAQSSSTNNNVEHLHVPVSAVGLPGDYKLQVAYLDGASQPVEYALSWWTSQTPLIAGDFNLDGTVDAADYDAWKSNLGDSLAVSPLIYGDGDGDGAVTTSDYSVWLTNLGASLAGSVSSVASSIPEPSGLTLVVLICTVVFVRRSVRNWLGSTRAGTKLGILWLCFVAQTCSAQTFVDVTDSAGVSYQQQVPSLTPESMIRMTGGAAAGDFDNDGWVDLYVTRLDDTDILFRNKGDGTFEDVSQSAGFTTSLPTNGAAWGDVDNDGDQDLYVTGVRTFSGLNPRFYLYINDGEGVFTEEAVTRDAEVDLTPAGATRSGFSVSLGDYNRDGYLDIHTNEWKFSSTPFELEQTASRLLKNRGGAAAGYFDDVTATAGVSVADLDSYSKVGSNEGVFSFASSLTDMDGDGWADLVIAGDFHTSRLFWNNRDGTFTDGTVDAGVGTDENGMGSAVGDYDGDGDLDWFVTSIYDPDDTCSTEPCGWDSSGNRLYRNEGGRSFSDQTDVAGVRDGGWGWGAAWLDYDNDQDFDLVMTNGIDFGQFDQPTDWEAPFNQDPMKLWENDGNGNFTEVAISEGIEDSASGKGLLTFDYDNDGDEDLFVVNNSGAPTLYRNETISTEEEGNTSANWLLVDTVGQRSNRDGIGAKITVDPDEDVAGDEIFREVSGGSHFLAQSDMRAHFGLGAWSDLIDSIEVTWPSGIVQLLTDVAPNQILTILEPDTADFNGDGRVDIEDQLLWRNSFGSQTDLAADGNANGIVDSADYALWLSRLGMANSPPSAARVASVPEPSSIALLSVICAVAVSNLHCRGPQAHRLLCCQFINLAG